MVTVSEDNEMAARLLLTEWRARFAEGGCAGGGASGLLIADTFAEGGGSRRERGLCSGLSLALAVPVAWQIGLLPCKAGGDSPTSSASAICTPNSAIRYRCGLRVSWT